MELPATPPPTPPDSTFTDGAGLGRHSKSANVAHEIVQTERSYVEALDDVVKGYKTQVMDYIRFCGLPLSPEDAVSLFGNIEDALEFSRNFLSELESCNFDPEKIAQAFVTNADGFYIYTVYCTNYPKAVSVLSSCQDMPEITEFFKACQKKLNHRLPLGAFLIKPVQRILKYHLLLRDLVASIQKERRKSMSIVEVALTTMSSIATHINEMKKQHEDAIHIQEIQAQLLGWDHDDLSLCGDLLLEDSLRMKGARNERSVYLFDRLLLVVKRKGEHLVYKGSIPSAKLTLTDLIIGEPLEFKISELDNLSNSFTFRPATVATKTRWTKAIKDLMVSFHTHLEGQKAKLSRRSATRKRTKSDSPSQVSSVKVSLRSHQKDIEEKSDSEEPLADPEGSLSVSTTVISRSRDSTPTVTKKTKITIATEGIDIKTPVGPSKVEFEPMSDDDDDDDDEVVGAQFELNLNVGTAGTVERKEDVPTVGVDAVDSLLEDEKEEERNDKDLPEEETDAMNEEGEIIAEVLPPEELASVQMQSGEESSIPFDHDYIAEMPPPPKISYADVARAPPLEEPKKHSPPSQVKEKSRSQAAAATPPPKEKDESSQAPVTTEEVKIHPPKEKDEWVTTKKSKGKLKQQPQIMQESPKIKKKEAKEEEISSKESKVPKKEEHQKKAASPSTAHKRKVRKEVPAVPTQKEEEVGPPPSQRRRPSSSCDCPNLHLILVSIALIIALLFALLTDYPLPLRVGLVCLPSAALLLFLCSGKRQAKPQLLS